MNVSANVSAEHTHSTWMDVGVARAPALQGSEYGDVAVIGSGIVGLSRAYEIALRGRSDVVLDRAEIGSGMTSRRPVRAASLDDFDNTIQTTNDAFR